MTLPRKTIWALGLYQGWWVHVQLVYVLHYLCSQVSMPTSTPATRLSKRIVKQLSWETRHLLHKVWPITWNILAREQRQSLTLIGFLFKKEANDIGKAVKLCIGNVSWEAWRNNKRQPTTQEFLSTESIGWWGNIDKLFFKNDTVEQLTLRSEKASSQQQLIWLN